MTYDKFFLVFGNSEIRLKQSERVVFSNFGIVNSYFFTRKENVDSFLHEGDNREANLTGLEIHQVMFNEGQP